VLRARAALLADDVRRHHLTAEPTTLARELAAVPLIDQHCHSIRRDWQRVGIDALGWRRCFTESVRPASLVSDVPAMRGYREFLRAFAGHLGVETDEAAIVSARDRLAASDGYLGGLLADAGVELLLVDTGYAEEVMLPAEDLATATGVEVRAVIRIERLAERVLAEPRAASTPTGFADAVSQAIEAELDASAIGMKSIAAYRSGLDLASSSAAEVRAALADRASQARRLDDPALVGLVLRTAAEIGQARGIPLQIHTGFGDDDLRLSASDPSLLRPLLRDGRLDGCPIVLLHCYPFVREAAYIASLYPNVSMDLSLAIPLLGGAGARAALAAALELCPTTKLLAGTDGHSYPEMHWRGAMLWRDALAAVMGGEVEADRMGSGEAVEIGAAILSGNARRLYRI
jgi:uncharacterized protein